MNAVGIGASLSPAATLLSALVTGHVMADFLLQGEVLSRRKNLACRALFGHVGLVLLTHLVFLAPFAASGPGLLLALVASAGLAGSHLLIDWAKSPLERRRRRPLTLFFVDQALHAAVLLAAWRLLLASDLGRDPMVPAAWLPPLAGWSLIASGFVLNGNGGTAIVRKLLERYSRELAEVPEPGADEPAAYRMGRMIGVLERLLVFLLVLLDQWGALGLVLAAKSLARWPELQSRHFAEYYLIGTLASILVAVLSGLAVSWAVF